ncbi:ABC transporter permease [Actinomadura sp. HBU206391]|uniref:ABC transporter permease n=1 Tax=Actinomadura sp. HBU206391 TaxID=2731692 RepID=UPI00164EFE72|nr:ABC transporter permease [Actinomadura sp. HBU206391]MBC6457469.1 ABC transporter permease [Actinomadura sp. HBU206391]
MMAALGVKSMRHYKPLFAGAIAAMVLGVTLIGVTATILSSAWSLSSSTAGAAVTLGGHTYHRDASDMQGITTVLALSAVVSGFMTIMVVAGTFAFSIALRRRDLGLLRLVGASGMQIRCMVLGEAVAVAVPTAAIGCVIAAVVTPPTVHALNRRGLSPVPLPERAAVGPLLFAYGAGLLLAVLAALVASQRAARVRPVEALRDAALDANIMTRGRCAVGVLTLAAGITMMSTAPGAGAANVTPLVIFGTFALTISAITLGPVYLPWLTRLFGLPGHLPAGLAGRLAVAVVTTSRRRTSSLVAPMLSITAVVGIMLGVMMTSDATGRADRLARSQGQVVVEPADGTGLDEETLRRVATAPGVRAVSAPAPLKVAFATASGEGGPGRPPGSGVATAAALDLPALAAVQRITAVEGRISALTGDQIAIRQGYVDLFGVHAGDRLRLGFFDGRTVTATVATVLHGDTSMPWVMISPALAGDQAAAPAHAIVRLDGSSGDLATTAQITRAAGPDTVRVVPISHWRQSDASVQDRLQHVVVFILAGPASIFALIAVAGTLVMAFSGRRREIAGLVLLGVSTGAIRRMVALEALLVTITGIGLAGLFVGLGLTGYHTALKGDFLATAIQVPWLELGGLAGGCLIVSTVTSVASVGRTLRRPAIALVGLRE